MGVMTVPAVWSDQDRMLTIADMQTAHVIGDEEYRAAAPFPVTIAPSALVTVG